MVLVTVQMRGIGRKRPPAGLSWGSCAEPRPRPGRTGVKRPSDERLCTQVSKQVKRLDRVIIRFAGDSGDGMQLTGDRFTQESASYGNDLSTLPNFPAEIRAPQGTLPGVSSFQVHFADHDILTAGDRPDVLVAMNPAALKANVRDVPKGATSIVGLTNFSNERRTVTRTKTMQSGPL